MQTTLGESPRHASPSWLRLVLARRSVSPVKRALGIVVVILVLFWIISAPRSAAATVEAILAALASVAHSITVFVQSLFT